MQLNAVECYSKHPAYLIFCFELGDEIFISRGPIHPVKNTLEFGKISPLSKVGDEGITLRNPNPNHNTVTLAIALQFSLVFIYIVYLNR